MLDGERCLLYNYCGHPYLGTHHTTEKHNLTFPWHKYQVIFHPHQAGIRGGNVYASGMARHSDDGGALYFNKPTFGATTTRVLSRCLPHAKTRSSYIRQLKFHNTICCAGAHSHQHCFNARFDFHSISFYCMRFLWGENKSYQPRKLMHCTVQ